MSHEPRTFPEIRQALRTGTITVRTLVARALAGSQAGAPQAWIARKCDDELLALADACDSRLAAEGPTLLDRLPLFGIPFAVKDNIDVAGLPTTAAYRGWNPAPAAAHAATVQRLADAGAIPLGKTNLDQFATGLVGTRSPYGAVPNAFDATKVSGGSSSGSAYVVATGQVPFSLGTDTAGSGRVPAGFHHIVGLKPTPGRVGTSGVIPACRSIDCVSVFALTADDAAEVLAVMEGPDPEDSYSRFEPGPARFGATLRVGVPAEPVFTGDPAYAARFEEAIAHLKALGHTVVPIDFAPLHRTAELLYGGPWVAERHAAVQAALAANPEAFDPSVRRVIEGATAFSATDTFRGLYTLQAARQASAATWQDVDLLMTPTAPGHPSMADLAADPIGANAVLGTYTNFVNLLGWCALALPFAFTPAGLPFGVTFIAPGNADAALARFGNDWQRSLALDLGAIAHPLPAAAPARRPAAAPGLPLVVVGAHLSGLPLNGQLTERGATFVEATFTTPDYRLYALPGTVPPKPGLQRTADGGTAIAVEVWDMPMDQVGSFLALIPAPLGLGSVQLDGGRWVHGFVCEAVALAGATDISRFGGWRAYLASR